MKARMLLILSGRIEFSKCLAVAAENPALPKAAQTRAPVCLLWFWKTLDGCLAFE
jgi:hypothetical protein